MTGQFCRLNNLLFALSVFGSSLLWAADTVVPTPKVHQSLDLQRYYQNALQGEQVQELETAQERFIALWLEQRTSAPEGGVLILHDVGHTPDWPYLLQQTRKYLPDTGWSTLAIDLPTPQHVAIGQIPLSDTAAAPATAQSDTDWESRILDRIASGIRYLNNQGIFNIAVLGYGDGAYWGARYLTERLSEEEEDGYALILYEPTLAYPELADFLGQLTIPTLDVYMADSDFAHRRAKERKAAALREDHPDYLQIHDASRHGFYGSPDIDRSTRRVWGWLRNHAAGYEAQLGDNAGP